MKNTIFTGAGVAIITPMNSDGSINFDKLGEIIDFNIDILYNKVSSKPTRKKRGK